VSGLTDENYMRLAIEVAKSGRGQTSPNPVVGAVIVKDGRVIGIGAHLRAGEEHAEVHALRMAGRNAENATAYVTLEPCSHHGKTPPCSDLLIENKVKRVVIATTDPNPLVAGSGIDRLTQAGIKVDVGIMKEEADGLNSIFYHFIDTKTPYVTLKSATSLDGKTATVTGESMWITSEESRLDVHRYRHEHDAILVGVNTVITDNPSLTTRLPNGGKNPIRIILDTSLRTPLDSKVLIDGEAETWIIVGKKVNKENINLYTQRGSIILQMDTERITIRNLLKLLGERGITSLFVEGGAEVNGSFIQEKQFNQMITYIAPKLIGGRKAPTSIGGSGIEKINDALNLTIKAVEQIGEDIKITSELKE
jgi:diaminohydroxyphosphoribosylaminopyrimidine deaminase / 5-amino-6-(5-phosphoribosylamino)uracil reductase